MLITSRDQTHFQKPTTSVPIPFQSDFVGASISELAEFVQETFGESGDPDEEAGDIADNIFGVLDDRTALDESILCLTDCSISPEEEAIARVIGGRATRQDEALVRYSDFNDMFDEATAEDITILHQSIDDPVHTAPVAPILSHELQTNANNIDSVVQAPPSETVVTDEIKEQVERWYKEVAGESKDVWIGLRLPSEYSAWCLGGVYQRGALEFLLDPDENEFNERGVLKTDL